MPDASKISCEQVVGAPAAADILPGRSGTYQVAVGIERGQKSRFAGMGVRLNPLQCAFVYEERGLDGAVVSPKSHGMSCPIVRAAVIWKVDHGSGRSGCSAARRPFRCLSRRTSGGRRSARIRQKHGRSVETKNRRLRLSRKDDPATGLQSGSMPIATNSFLVSLAIPRRDHQMESITARPSAVIGD